MEERGEGKEEEDCFIGDGETGAKERRI